MADVFSKDKRSEIMSRVKGKGNKATEQKLAQLFRQNGIAGWRRHLDLVGKPDFTFRKERVVVFVDGCFWHGCPEHSTIPATNTVFWSSKIMRNKARDRLVNRTLRECGWQVVRIWEHALKRSPQRVLGRVKKALADANKG